MANPKGCPQNLKPLEKGTERTREIGRMGGIASGKARREKMDANRLVELVGEYLMLPEKKGDITTLDDVTSLEEMEKKNRRIIDVAIAEFCKRLKSGDKRAITQLIELLNAGQDKSSQSNDNGLVEAINNVAEIWKQNNE